MNGPRGWYCFFYELGAQAFFWKKDSGRFAPMGVGLGRSRERGEGEGEGGWVCVFGVRVYPRRRTSKWSSRATDRAHPPPPHAPRLRGLPVAHVHIAPVGLANGQFRFWLLGVLSVFTSGPRGALAAWAPARPQTPPAGAGSRCATCA
jgi:hypothetical protein